MVKYHINPETSRVNICRASVKDCPVSGSSDHYDSKEEAFAARENKLTEELGTFTPLAKKTETPKPVITPEMEKASNAYYEFYLNEIRKTPELDSKRITDVANIVGLDPDFLKGEVARHRERDAELRAEAKKAYDAKVEEVIAAVPKTIKKGSIVAVPYYGTDVIRMIKVDIIRRGKMAGNTVHDGEVYEEIYMEDVDVSTVLKTSRNAPLKADTGWKFIPGEGRFKTIRDADGNARGSIQSREGFYILGARDEATGKLIHFEENQFAFEDEAAGYLNEWAAKNPSVKLSS